jgi:hypothetical protein
MCDFYGQLTYAYIWDDNMTYENKISIQKYNKNKLLKKQITNEEKNIYCCEGHQLINYTSIFKNSYFKHVQHNLTKYQQKLQCKFDSINIKIDDVIFHASIDDNIFIFQDDEIDEETIISYSNKCKNNNTKLHWIINCNKSIKINESGDIFLITFLKEEWKYKNFISLECIYLNVEDKLYKINPSCVKSHMIDVREYKIINDFLFSLKIKINIWDDSLVIQCVLYHNQRGAGCGKTYESIQLLNNDALFINKHIFIYLTKMHTAKEVIFKELYEQQLNGKLENLTITEESENVIVEIESGDYKKKQYKLTYFNKLKNKECIVIIGTIDSFMFAIGDKNNRCNDFFAGIVKSIKNGFVKTDSDGSIRYTGDSIKLNKECLVLIDEAQDLGSEYIEAVCSIMRNTYIDTYVIGDKLQSIWGDHNIHTHLENNDLPNIQIQRSTGINHVMRFHNYQFKNFVNNIIDFEKYNLPKIEKICDLQNCKYSHEDELRPYTIFETSPIYKDDKDNNKVDSTIDKIINYVNHEVNKYNYLPNNFMFIFPILSNNYLASRLESTLQEFWMDKFNNVDYINNVLINNEHWKNKLNNEYHKYVYFHKSDEGKSINLKDSENATRILSIHASKGNGAEVVFLLGLSEYTLKIFSKDANNLVYDSLLHVALTRQKKSLYVGIVNNGDKIYNIFKENFDVESDENIEPRIEDIRIHNKYGKIIDYAILQPEIFKQLDDNYIKPYDLNAYIPEVENTNSIVEWGHHIIRYYVFLYYIQYNICNDNNVVDIYKHQFVAVVNKISKLKIIQLRHTEYYNYIYDNFGSINKKQYTDSFPILLFKTNEYTKYSKYKNNIIDFIKNIQRKIHDAITLKRKLPSLCPLEIVILYHIYKTHDDGIYSKLTIMDIYSIIHCYDECSNSIDSIHDEYNCLCKIKFTNYDNINQTTSYVEMRQSIKNHFEKTKDVNKLYLNYVDYLNNNLKGASTFKYNMFKTIVGGGPNDNFKITSNFVLIAFSPDYIIYFIIKPQFNKLNFNEIMTDGIMHKYLLSIKPLYSDKKILTCIFTLDSIKPIFINFNLNNNDTFLKNIIKDYLISEYTSKHMVIKQYYDYHYKNKPATIIKFNEYIYEKIKNFENLPLYIKIYFYDIAKEIEDSKTLKKSKKYIIDNVLNKINDVDTFLTTISNYLLNATHKYLDITEDVHDVEYYDF